MISWKQIIVVAATSCLLFGDDFTDEIVGQQAAPPVASGHVHSAPSIILHSATHGKNSSGNCVVEVNPIGAPGSAEYAIKISIPDSVTVVEVQPDRTAYARRNFRIRLDQPSVPVSGNRQADMPIVFGSTDRAEGSIVHLPGTDNVVPQPAPKIPVHNASGPIVPIIVPHRTSPQNIAPQNIAPQKTSPRQLSVPIEKVGEFGFRRNPYFETTANTCVVETNLSDGSLKASTQDFPGRPVQASFRPPARDSFTDQTRMALPIPVVHSDTPDCGLIQSSPLSAELFGPTALGLGAIGDYVIEITSLTSEETTEIVIQLDVPDGLEIVLLGREASIDQKTVTWRLPELAGNTKTLLRYRVKSVSEGSQAQTVGFALGCDGLSNVVCDFETRVLADYETLDAPKLDFESK